MTFAFLLIENYEEIILIETLSSKLNYAISHIIDWTKVPWVLL